jgi:hypothetical protein
MPRTKKAVQAIRPENYKDDVVEIPTPTEMIINRNFETLFVRLNRMCDAVEMLVAEIRLREAKDEAYREGLEPTKDDMRF